MPNHTAGEIGPTSLVMARSKRLSHEDLSVSESGTTRFLRRLIFPIKRFFSTQTKPDIETPHPEGNVAGILASLPPNCAIVHDVAARYGNIEHLIIGENGAVFLIETKAHH